MFGGAMVATLQSPNGVATGMVYRRRYKRVEYATSPEQHEEMGYKPETWQADAVGFFALCLRNPRGEEERDLLQARLTFLRAGIPPRDDEGTVTGFVDQDRLEMAREEFLKELAWRIPEWGYAEEDDTGNVIAVPAPGEHPDNWKVFTLLSTALMTWLIEEACSAHLPDPKVSPSPLTSALPPDGVTVDSA
jgi:hypothetical protein